MRSSVVAGKVQITLWSHAPLVPSDPAGKMFPAYETRRRGTVTPDDFFKTQVVDHGDGFPPYEKQLLDRQPLEQLRSGPLRERGDLTVAIALAQLAHQEFESYGTDSSERITDTDAQLVLRALRSCLRRLGIDLSLPWRDLTTFRSHWLRNGCSGSWQARRDLLESFFEPIHRQLYELEEREFQAELADAVSPHAGTGWQKVDVEMDALRRRFRQATTPQDYRAVGTHCVGVLEAISRTVYDPQTHLLPGEDEPPVDRTKQRIGRYVEVELSGKAHESLRGVVTKTIVLAHEIKHRETPGRREAGVAADAVILLANILRRLAEPSMTEGS